MDQDTRYKVARLPAWARTLIKHLEFRSEPAIEEAARCRSKATQLEERNRKLSDQIQAMGEMFRYAALGGSDVAKTVVRILEDYEIYSPVTTKKDSNAD
jgi:hypothetical protein